MEGDLMTTVYLAGPIQHAEDGGHGWREGMKAVLEQYGLDWLDPLDKYDGHANDVVVYTGEPPEDPPSGAELVSGEEIVETDKELIDESDALAVGWSGVRSVGTPMEVIYAYQQEKPVAVFAGIDSISPWLEYHADFIADSSGDCALWLMNNVPEAKS